MTEQNRDATDIEEKGFRKWKDKVNAFVSIKANIACDDLPDVDYWSMYESGVSSSVAANRVIKYAMEN